MTDNHRQQTPTTHHPLNRPDTNRTYFFRSK